MTDLLQTYNPEKHEKLDENIFGTSIDGLLYIANNIYQDDRGFFTQVGIIPELNNVRNTPFVIKQLNQSRSEKNVVRGFHAESWNKFVTITSGICLSIIVDIRPESSTFLNKEYFLLGKDPQKSLTGSVFIPERLGNSICVIEGPVNYFYAVDLLYTERDTSGDKAVSLFDPDIHAQWPINKSDMIISDRDKDSITLRELFPEKF